MLSQHWVQLSEKMTQQVNYKRQDKYVFFGWDITAFVGSVIMYCG